MADEAVSVQVLPCGGIAMVTYGSSDTGPWSLSRSVLLPDGTYARQQTLFSGPAPSVSPQGWLDLGEGALPLDPATTYVYTLVTATGSASASIVPAASLELEFFDITEFIHRFIMAGVQNVTLPGADAFRNKATVRIAMPLTGTPALPIISVAEDLVQSAEQGIGHTVNSDFIRNRFDINQIATRRFRIAVLCSSTEERSFYEALVIGLFQAMMTSLMGVFGLDIRYSFQTASSQVVDTAPGFYYCEIGLQFDGVYRATLTTTFPEIGPPAEIAINSDAL